MLKHFVALTNMLAPLREDRGATAVEYGLLVALIAAIIVVTVGLLGAKLNNIFNNVLTAI